MTTLLNSPTWALPLAFTDNLILRGFTIVGGAAVGALLAGAVGKVAARLLTTRQLPVWGVRILRLLGGVAAGWLVYLFVMSSGGGGFGGPGGGSAGSPSNGSTKRENHQEKETKRKETGQPEVKKSVRVEVLGAKTLGILGKPTNTPYRIEEMSEGRLYNLQGIKEALRQLKKKHESLKVTLVIYNDSPAEDLPVVAALHTWLKEEDMGGGIVRTEQDSPEVKNNKP